MLTFPRAVIDDLITHALEENPNECCGVIAGVDSTAVRGYRITNTAKSAFRYLMDPQEFLNADRDAERRGRGLSVFYHSHTHSSPYPSPTDVRMALESGWLDPFYLLVSLEDKQVPEVRLYRISPQGNILERDFTVA